MNVLFLAGHNDRESVMKQSYPEQLQNTVNLTTCSAFKVSSMKICCSFSFTKLMQNCSKPFLCQRRNRITVIY